MIIVKSLNVHSWNYVFRKMYRNQQQQQQERVCLARVCHYASVLF